MTIERAGMPVKNRICRERCPETGRDIVWPWKLAMFAFSCSVTSVSLVHTAFSTSWESAKVWGEISPGLSFPELDAFWCLFSASCSSEPGHWGKRMFCRKNLEMWRCWEAGPCVFWQFLSTEFHWRQATETAVRNFILMSIFICNQQEANKNPWCFPACPGLWQIWKRLLFFQTFYFPHFPEVQKCMLLCLGHLHNPAKAWLCSRAWLTEGWTQQPCASLNNVSLPSFTW